MKNIKSTLTIALLVSSTFVAYSQNQAIELLKAGQQDAQKINDAYMDPFLKSIGISINNGWYQTARPLGLGGFNLTIQTTAVITPSADRTYNVNDLGLSNTRLTDPNGSATSPTLMGSTKDGPSISVFTQNPITNQDTSIASFNLPTGIGNILPLPMANLGVGVGFGTELMVRYMPRVALFGESSIGLFGFGVKHDVKQWIPGVKNVPFLDMAVMLGYTNLSANLTAGEYALKPASGNEIYNSDPQKDYSQQKLDFGSRAWNTNFIVSAKFAILTLHLSAGYQAATTHIDFLGEYPVTVPNENALNPSDPSFGKPLRIENIKDPIRTEVAFGSMRFGGGFRLKLAALTIFADYAIQGGYQSATAGIGLNIQSLVPPSI